MNQILSVELEKVVLKHKIQSLESTHKINKFTRIIIINRLYQENNLTNSKPN